MLQMSTTQYNKRIKRPERAEKEKTKNTTLSEQVQNLIEKYHTVRTGPKSNRKIPHCQNRSKI
jgi:hypothetical protein